MGEYASKGVAGTGLGLGIAGTALGLLNSNGILGGLFGGYSNASVAAMQGNGYVAVLAQKDSEISELKAEKYTDNKVAEAVFSLNNRLNTVAGDLAAMNLNLERRVAPIESQLCSLAQATNTAIAGINATLSNITKQVVPASVICPEVMPRYNSFVAPTASDTSTSS